MPLWLRVLKVFFPDAGWYVFMMDFLLPEGHPDEKVIFGPYGDRWTEPLEAKGWGRGRSSKFSLRKPTVFR